MDLAVVCQYYYHHRMDTSSRYHHYSLSLLKCSVNSAVFIYSDHQAQDVSFRR